jgi:hypothetical protein
LEADSRLAQPVGEAIAHGARTNFHSMEKHEDARDSMELDEIAAK